MVPCGFLGTKWRCAHAFVRVGATCGPRPRPCHHGQRSPACVDLIDGINLVVAVTTTATAGATWFTIVPLRACVTCVWGLPQDQLDNVDQGREELLWLPVSLPPHVFFMVSTLPVEGGCFAALHRAGLLPAPTLAACRECIRQYGGGGGS